MGVWCGGALAGWVEEERVGLLLLEEGGLAEMKNGRDLLGCGSWE